jgi:hypothetical protein
MGRSATHEKAPICTVSRRNRCIVLGGAAWQEEGQDWPAVEEAVRIFGDETRSFVVPEEQGWSKFEKEPLHGPRPLSFLPRGCLRRAKKST